eukprot:900940-Prorocentrum_minimum.AAC.1
MTKEGATPRLGSSLVRRPFRSAQRSRAWFQSFNTSTQLVQLVMRSTCTTAYNIVAAAANMNMSWYWLSGSVKNCNPAIAPSSGGGQKGVRRGFIGQV